MLKNLHERTIESDTYAREYILFYARAMDGEECYHHRKGQYRVHQTVHDFVMQGDGFGYLRILPETRDSDANCYQHRWNKANDMFPFNFQFSIVNCQLSTINYQLSIP